MLSVPFCVLLLVSPVRGVCQVCFGEAYLCKGAASTCPWQTGVAQNAEVVGHIIAGTADSAKTSTLHIASLLPIRMRKVFTRATLDVISSIMALPKDGVEYDPSGKGFNLVCAAIRSGLCTKTQAAEDWLGRMGALDESDSNYGTKLSLLSSQHKFFQGLYSHACNFAVQCVFVFVLATLSKLHCRKKDSAVALDSCISCDDDDGGSSSSSPSPNANNRTATLFRPQTFEQMVALLNDWALFFLSIGISPMVVMPFLQDVAYLPLADGSFEWPVGFELFILYLNEIEKCPNVWNMANVFAKSGAIDVRRADAEKIARARYPPHCFRVGGGSPGMSQPGGRHKGAGAFEFANTTKHNSSSHKACVAYNSGVDHTPGNVDAQGRCKFAHVCNQWVTDKGKNGQCSSTHWTLTTKFRES